jgi:hypothetical protein
MRHSRLMYGEPVCVCTEHRRCCGGTEGRTVLHRRTGLVKYRTSGNSRLE